jgi:hypothetical protein
MPNVRVTIVSIVVVFSLAATTTQAGIEAGDVRISAGLLAAGYGEVEFEDGVLEAEVSGVGTNSSISGVNSVAATGGIVQIGFIPTEILEIGANLSVGHVNLGGDFDGDATSLSVGPYLSVNLPLGSSSVYASPVLGLGYAGLYVEDVFDAHQFQLEVGGELKFFVAKDASIDLGVFFDYTTGHADLDFGGDDIDIEGWSVGPRLKISIWP